MFFRKKRAGNQVYLQLVENRWRDRATRQRVIATIGRLDHLLSSGELHSLLRSGAKFCESSFNYTAAMDDEDILTTHQVAKLLKVSPSAVISWIDQGRLAAFRTPGGHRRVTVGEVRRFLGTTDMPAPPVVKQSESRRRIFVIDDEPRIIRTIQREFQPYEDHYEVKGCVDGIEALIQIGAFQPHLVLLDVYMEGLDGFEVCRRLRRVEELEDILIVAITAIPSEEARARILDCGANDYWVKPVRAQEVIALFEKEQPASDAL
ncbi:MAG: response regulator [Bradymonadales bacterium]|nr:response regulator [Bradymonadales bacterium]